MSSIDYNLCTEGQTKIHTLTWTIQNFVEELQNNQVFHTENSKDGLRFELKVQRLSWDSRVFEGYYLSQTPLCLKSNVTLESQMQYQSKTKKELINNYHTVQANEWQRICSFYRAGPVNRALQNDDLKLTLKFVFTVKDNNINNSCPIVPTQLSSDFRYLLHNGLFSDVVMKSAENIEFKVHKAVLASRSAVLKAQFKHKTTESTTNVVKSPLDSDVLKEALTFIYSDEAPNVDQMPEKLLFAADYYQLGRLKSLCEGALQRKLTVENAIETLNLADMYSANSLKKLTLQFIKDGKELVTKTEGWTTLKSVELIKSICEYILVEEVATNSK